MVLVQGCNAGKTTPTFWLPNFGGDAEFCLANPMAVSGGRTQYLHALERAHQRDDLPSNGEDCF